MEATSLNQYHEAESSKPEESSFGLSALSFNLGYDGKRAANNLTGLGNYSRSLIEQLAVQFPASNYLVYTPKVKENIAGLPMFALSNIKLVLPKMKIPFWRTFGIRKQLIEDQIQLFHGLSHEIPYRLADANIKTIVTMHDLIFLRHPQYYKWIDRQIYTLKSKYACQNANKIIAISEKTKEDIIDLYGIDSSKIEVIYQSCDDSFKTPLSKIELEKAQKTYQLPNRYLLYVGTIEPRKNLLALIRALPNIASSIPLVVVGKPTVYAKAVEKEIKQLNLQDRVIFLKVPFAHLPAIYQLASLFILPSYYEGFGIPIIEALYSQVPVIAAKGSCLEEAGGPDSLYFSPDNVSELADKINHVLTDHHLASAMRKKGLAYVQRFNANLIGKQLMDCYLQTLKQ